MVFLDIVRIYEMFGTDFKSAIQLFKLLLPAVCISKAGSAFLPKSVRLAVLHEEGRENHLPF